jgi:hypothetical protein
LGTGAPRWVKVFGIIAIVLVLLFVVLHLSGHGFGGHGMKDVPGMDIKGMDHMEHGVKPP